MRFPAESFKDQGAVDVTTTGVVTTTYSPVVGATVVPPAPTKDMGLDSKNGVANLPNGVTPEMLPRYTRKYSCGFRLPRATRPTPPLYPPFTRRNCSRDIQRVFPLSIRVTVFPISSEIASSPIVRTNQHAPAPDAGSIVTIVCRSEEHTSELQSRGHLVCRLLLEKKKTIKHHDH